VRETPEGESFSHDVARPRAGTREFLSADYVEDAAQRRLRPVEGIDRCPWSLDARRCIISKHNWRSRKTGPGFPVRILRCVTHSRYFTVYPVGFTPYARQRLSPLSSAVRTETAAPEAVSRQWDRTVFEAAVRAAEGKLGLRDVVHGDPVELRYPAQRRRIERAGHLLGLSAETDERIAEVVAQSLTTPGLDHQAARRAFSRAATLRERGVVIVSMLRVLPTAGAIEARLLGAGFLVGLWGRPALWDARTSSRTFPPFAAPSALPPRSPPEDPTRISLPGTRSVSLLSRSRAK
jgi:hypothetical protein